MKEILEMIESVDPNDTAKLDEIDARVLCYLYGEVFSHFEPYGKDERAFIRCVSGKEMCKPGNWGAPQIYTRSRDALKAIRPEGWLFDIYRETFEDKWNCKIWTTGQEYDEKSPSLARKMPTEELAELHAIIQAISHERGR